MRIFFCIFQCLARRKSRKRSPVLTTRPSSCNDATKYEHSIHLPNWKNFNVLVDPNNPFVTRYPTTIKKTSSLLYSTRKNPISLSIYRIYLSICLSIYLSICLSVCLSLYPSIDRSISLSLYLSISLSVCLSACLPACLPGWLAGWLSVCLSLYL